MRIRSLVYDFVYKIIILCLFSQKESAVWLKSFKYLGFTGKSILHSRNFGNDLVFYSYVVPSSWKHMKFPSFPWKIGYSQLPVQEISEISFITLEMVKQASQRDLQAGC